MSKYIGSTPVVTQVDGYNRTEADSTFVDVTGDTVTGSLIVDQDLTVDTNTLYVDSTNNRVGIGTSSPSNPLHVSASGLSTPALIESTSTVSRIAFKDTATTDGNSVRLGSAGNDMSFLAGGSEAMRIDSSGNVGIGTSSPSAPSGKCLTLYDATIPRLNFKNSTTGNTSTDGSELYVSGNQLVIQNRESSDIVFGTAGTERLRIDSSGNVGIGTSSPDEKLEVYQGNIKLGTDTNTTSKLIFERSAANRAEIYVSNTNALQFDTDGSERMRINSNGDVLVGTTNISTNSGTQLYSNGTIYTHLPGTNSTQHVRFYRDSSVVGSIATTGTSTAYNTSSDERLKENIADAQPASDLIDGIQVREFDWKADGEHQRYGMVAQELEAVAPEAVTKGETDEDMWSVDYSKLVPMLVKEIQDLRKRVVELENAE